MSILLKENSIKVVTRKGPIQRPVLDITRIDPFMIHQRAWGRRALNSALHYRQKIGQKIDNSKKALERAAALYQAENFLRRKNFLLKAKMKKALPINEETISSCIGKVWKVRSKK